jgi:hypothetical protein
MKGVKYKDCRECLGTGNASSVEHAPCPACNGVGTRANIMTVDDLRKALEGVRGDLEVIVEVMDDPTGDPEHAMGALCDASAEARCDGIECFYITGDGDLMDELTTEDDADEQG